MSIETSARQPKGIPSGGQFAATTHDETPVTLAPPAPDHSRFPHPDSRYPHPMGCWPEDVEDPSSISLGEEDGIVDEVPRDSLYPDPQNARTISQPSCTVVMGNGASLTVVQVGDPEGGNSEERFSGDWDQYLKGDSHARDQVLETAHETMLQAAIK